MGAVALPFANTAQALTTRPVFASVRFRMNCGCFVGEVVGVIESSKKSNPIGYARRTSRQQGKLLE